MGGTKAYTFLDGKCQPKEKGEMHTKFWSENQKGKDHSEDLDLDRKIIL
jgi:hypothetical protein